MTDTRSSILREAARLFSRRGYHGTSTREIADAVGIRQPSLFHHFASKQEIAEALFQYDYDRSPVLQLKSELPDASPAVRLFQWMRREVLVEITSAYDLRGIYLSTLLEEPEFAHWRKVYDAAVAAGVEVVREGVKTGDFVDKDPEITVGMIEALLNQAVRWAPEKPGAFIADEAAEFALRLALRRPSRISAIKREADRLLADAGTPWPEPLL